MRLPLIVFLSVGFMGCGGSTTGPMPPIRLTGPKVVYIHSPDGASQDNLWAVNLDGSDPVRLDLPQAMLLEDGNTSVQISENGRTILRMRITSGGSQQIFERSPITGVERQITQMSEIRSFRLAAGGDTVLVMGAHGNPDDLELVDVRTTKKHRLAYGYGVFALGDVRGSSAFFIGALPNDNNPRVLAVDLGTGAIQNVCDVDFLPAALSSDTFGDVFFQSQAFQDMQFKKLIYGAPPRTPLREVQFGVQKPSVIPGARIVYTDVKDFPTFPLFVMNVDGTDVRQFTFAGGIDFCPAYVEGVPENLVPH